MAKRAKKSVKSGVLRATKGNAKDFGAVTHKVKDIFDYEITNAGLTMNPASSIKIPPKSKAPKKRVMILHDEELSTWIKYLNSLSNSRADRRFKIICQTLLSSALCIN
jgi:phage integrase family protein